MNFAKYLGVGLNKIPSQPEEIENPKLKLFELARNSRKKVIYEDIPPEVGSSAIIGKNYNGRLKAFVIKHWDIENARERLRGKSLDKAMAAFSSLRL